MEPFIGQVLMFGGNFAPRSWAFCHGQLLAISSNSALFSILGTIYGGDGRTTFGLPDLRGRVAIQQGNGPGLPSYRLGQRGGNENTTLLTSNLPPAQISAPATAVDPTSSEPVGNIPTVAADDEEMYSSATPTGIMGVGSIVGAQNSSFSNKSPVLAVNYIIALQGTYPSRN